MTTAVTQRRSVHDGLLPLTEAALTTTGIAVALGFVRVFEDNAFVRPLVGTIIASHALAIIARRLGLTLSVSALMSAAGLLVSQSLLYYGDTTRFGLPTAATRTQIDADLREAWTLFGNISAPVESITGFLLASSLALWIVMFLADWAAFRLRSGFEAILPAGVVFIFVSLFAADHRRLLVTALFAASVLFFVVAHRASSIDSVSSSWLGATARRGTRAVLAAGAAIASVALVFGLVAGPRLPGAQDEPIIDLEKVGDGPGTRVALNPLVGIQAQLVDLPNTVVFTVRADRPTYWKVTSLPSFNGREFTANESFSKAEGELDNRASDTTTTPLEQQFVIEGLAGEWLPAAHEPQAVDTNGEFEVNWNPNISSLILRDRNTSVKPGLNYKVTSAITQHSLEQIQNAPVPGDVDDVFLDLPDEFSEKAKQIAREVTAGATTPYEQALALQNYFLAFDYDINVAAGHDISRIDQFLDARVGYCEQFSTAFAAMARSLGIPTRVSVGFQAGQYSTEEELYRVRGADAHAWPEILLEDVGWLRFEPTPGRGAPGDELYTNNTPSSIVDDPTNPSPVTSIAPIAPEREFSPGDIDPADDLSPASGLNSDSTPLNDSFSIPASVVFAILGAMLAVLVVLGSILALKARKRTAQLAVHADENRRQIAEAWLIAEDHLSMGGIPPAAAETPLEYSRRVSTRTRIIRSEIATLATLISNARFAADAPSDDDVQKAQEAAAKIAKILDNGLTWLDRSRYALDIRPLLPARSSIDET